MSIIETKKKTPFKILMITITIYSRPVSHTSVQHLSKSTNYRLPWPSFHAICVHANIDTLPYCSFDLEAEHLLPCLLFKHAEVK